MESNFTEFFHKAFWVIASVCSILITYNVREFKNELIEFKNELKEMRMSMEKLNVNIAVVVTEQSYLKDKVSGHDIKIEKLEQGSKK